MKALTNPYWQSQDEEQALYCADALEWLREAPLASRADALITDPPYASGGFSEAGRKAAGGQGLRSSTRRDRGWFSGDNMGTAGIAWLLRSMVVAARPLLKPTASILIFCDWRQVVNLAPAIESAGVRYQNLVVWDKGSPALGRGFRAQHELIMHFTCRARAKYYDTGAGNVLTVKRPSSTTRRHPTEKPIDLLADLIRVVTPHRGLIIDPFAGSGTVLAAARAMGRRAVGIENDPAICETAAAWLTDYVADMPGMVGRFQLPLLASGETP